jgi:uncharacterized protein
MRCAFSLAACELVLRKKQITRSTLRADIDRHAMRIDSTLTLSTKHSDTFVGDDTEIHGSHYIDPTTGDGVYRHHRGCALTARDAAIVNSIRSHVLTTDYPCVMARSVFNRDAFRVATYGDLGSPLNALQLAQDLYEFSAEFPAPVNGAVSFVACFDGPAPSDEMAFENAMWTQLQLLHGADQKRFGWSEAVQSDPDSPDFSFSVGGRAFFLIGMHPAASRIARRTALPMIVFNLHEQFVELRADGKFDKVRDTIRSRDQQLQGSMNPMSADYGERSEAAQYSGRDVGREWACPFHHGKVSR